MTDITLEQRARELLAAEHRKCERYTEADLIDAGDVTALGRMALNAIKEALRLSAGADWVLVPLDAVTAAATELTFADREGAAADLLNAMLAAAPKPEDS